MNKTAIKNYAIWARVQLIESAKQRAYEYEITESGENNPNLETIGGRLLSKVEKEQRQQLISQIRQKGYTQVIEEAAYTWFNRFIALRFMEVNGYLPSKVRVFTDESEAFKPEILKEAMTIELDGLDRQLILELLEKQNNEELYKYLLIAQCNALNAGLPYMFEKIANWTELLFPANLLRTDSVICRLISDIAPKDWEDEVEIIGWMYQYYISEKHDEVVDPLHGKTVKKEDIPAATQLFTTDWVVRYILDNSLGRYWIERHPDSKLADKLMFFIMPKDGNLPIINENIRPEELKVLDPCVGSGHFLSYAFDVLLEIYRECGWSDRDAARSIIENNLYGLDIDDRAAQLACFAVSMKARKYNRRILSSDTVLHVMAMQEADWITDELVHFVSKYDHSICDDLREIRIAFNNAKEYGSIINMPEIDMERLYNRIAEIQDDAPQNLVDIQYQRQAEDLLPLIRQAEILLGKYDVVATNPPYLNRFSALLKAFVEEKYPDHKADLFSVFVFRNFMFCKANGYSGFLTPNGWMFLKSFEDLRKYIIAEKKISTLIQMAHNAFSSIAAVDVCAFVLKNGFENVKGSYIRLTEHRGDIDYQREKVLEALINKNCGYYFETDDAVFSLIPGCPIAYWCSQTILDCFKETATLGSIAEPRQGVKTLDNDLFLKLWFEPSNTNISYKSKSIEESILSKKKWFPYNKGGAYRKWYGNNDYLVNWYNDGFDMKKLAVEKYNSVTRTITNISYFFKPGLTWSSLSSGNISLRAFEEGFIFDSKGSSMFFTDPKLKYYILALMNSKVSTKFLEFLAPTMDFNIGSLAKIPVKVDSDYLSRIDELAITCIELSKADWDSFETSWDFLYHPLIQKNTTIENAYLTWKSICDQRFLTIKQNEEEINRLFIEIYGLSHEMLPHEDEKDVSIRKADLQREIKSLISYAVGCMFGRYSIDHPGLCYAGGNVFDASKYKTIIPDSDNIIPICDDDYFNDDIVGRFIGFIRMVYGSELLEENLRFIADVLGGKGTSREVIRNYFINEFYTDHCNNYAVAGAGRRPIYWLFSSGKKNGFKALIYMHRYQPDLLARMRTDYVHEQQERYRTQLTMLEDSMQTASASDRVKLNKQIAKIKDQALELQKYEEKIHHLADQMIPIDLDDGVKVNYAKFQEVLEKIK